MMETDKPLVSAVILSYNRRMSLENTLRMLEKDSYPSLEVIVVDNASTDGSQILVEQGFPKVLLIRSEKNMGIYSCNRGFEAAQGKYILVLDDDSYPLGGCIARSVEELEKDPRLGCVTARIMNPGGTSQWPEDEEEKVHDTYCFIGCGAVLRKDAFSKTGYYPEDFFLFHNELTTSLRLINMGYAIRYYPDIRCFHESPPSKRMNDRRLFFLVRNGSWNIWQFVPLRHLWYYYPGFIIKNLYLAIRYKAFSGFIKGFLSSFLKFQKYAFSLRSPCNAEVYLKRLRKNIK